MTNGRFLKTTSPDHPPTYQEITRPPTYQEINRPPTHLYGIHPTIHTPIRISPNHPPTNQENTRPPSITQPPTHQSGKTTDHPASPNHPPTNQEKHPTTHPPTRVGKWSPHRHMWRQKQNICNVNIKK